MSGLGNNDKGRGSSDCFEEFESVGHGFGMAGKSVEPRGLLLRTYLPERQV